MPPSLAHRLTALLRLRVVIPVLLTAALLAFAFSITDLPNVMGSIEAIPVSTWILCLGFAAVYLILKGLEFHLFLRRLGISVPWSSFLLAYAVGELSITIPSGIYAQNYVLKKVRAASFLRSAAATTAVLVIEGTLILFTLLVLKIPGWDWLRPLILAVFAVAAVLLAVARRLGQPSAPRTKARRSRRMHMLVLALRKMIGDLRRLLSPQAMVPGTLLALGYLGALVGAFLAVAHGVGVPELTFVQAATIYFFSLSVMLALGGLLTQVGIMEVVGLSAAQAWGYDLNKGLAMLLGFRIVWTAGVWLLSCPPVLALYAELSRSPGDDLEKPSH